MSFARIGSTVNFLIMGSVYAWMKQYFTGYECLGFALLVGTFKKKYLRNYLLNYFFSKLILKK